MEEKINKDKFTDGSITVSIGKPDKYGKRGVSVEFTVKRFTDESEEDYNKKYNFYKQKALSELR